MPRANRGGWKTCSRGHKYRAPGGCPRLTLLGVAVLLTTGSATALASDEAPAGTPVAIRNVSVLPLDRDRVIPGQTVVIDGGVIRQMGPARTTPIPAGATKIDGTGKYLMPGLVDLHVHLHASTEAEQQHILKLFVANGVTTILNLRGLPQILELRAAVADGRAFGPVVVTAGTYINEPFVFTPDQVDSAVTAQKRAGYDFVKFHGDLSREAYARLNSAARREGIRVVGHAPRNLGIEALFEEGQYALAHIEEFLYDTSNSSKDSSLAQVEAQIPEFARSTARAKIWVMPNLTAYKAIGSMVNDLDAVLARSEVRYLPPANRETWGPAMNPYTARLPKERYPAMVARYKLLEKMVRAFNAEGVRLLLGTDAMNTGVVPGFSAHDELADLVAARLTPLEALRAATVNAAEFLGNRGDHGTVEVGQKADLLLLNANPLKQIANSRRIAGVMLRGRWLSRADLDLILAGLKAPGD